MSERTLLVKILGDAKGALGSMAEVEGKSASMGEHIKGMIGPLAAVAGAGAIVEFGKKSLDAFNDVAGGVFKLQTVTGESAESMSRLRFAAEETGVGQEQLVKVVEKGSKAMMAHKDAFDAAGIAIRDVHTGAVLPLNTILENR